jgi:ureidoacrylate peracid hydrolase
VGQTIRAPDGRESRILIRDNWGTDIVPKLKPQADDVVVYKHRFSGFYETELDATLKRLEVKHLIFTGCTTSVCVWSRLSETRCSETICLCCSRTALASQSDTIFREAITMHRS